jgi:hypothetical protein
MKGEVGALHTVSTNSKIADSDGARPFQDLPDEFPSDINYDWYINRCNEILYDIGYLSKSKQIEFF